jgi:two-component system nitrogen regulation response regulator GlnG
MPCVLVVDDEQSICWGLARLGRSVGHKVVTASSAEQALALIASERPDVIVLDVRLPGMDGLTAMERFQQTCGDIPIIVITAYGNLETAVSAIRNGAFEYLAKPFDLERVERVLARALASRPRSVPLARDEDVTGMVGRSQATQRLFKQIALAAASDASVIVCGESGTGKELIARAIHQYGNRASGPFVAVNVASLSPSLAERELFGHERGAYTGADQERKGLLIQANTGTLFLDEVADIPLAAQVKLLRALEHGEVISVGCSQPTRTDFRVVCATHQDLLAKVDCGAFRHDLYFRLAVFRIDVPPLRQRREDIGELARHFLRAAECGRASELELSPAALAELQRRPWYGNVRELRNAIEHAVIIARGGVIEPEHLPRPIVPAACFGTRGCPPLEQSIVDSVYRWTQSKLGATDKKNSLYQQFLQLVEPPFLQAALHENGGQCARTARTLGLHRTTLRKKLEVYAAKKGDPFSLSGPNGT